MKAFSSSSGNLSTDRMSSSDSEDWDEAQSLDALYQRAHDLYTTEDYRSFIAYSRFEVPALHTHVITLQSHDTTQGIGARSRLKSSTGS